MTEKQFRRLSGRKQLIHLIQTLGFKNELRLSGYCVYTESGNYVDVLAAETDRWGGVRLLLNLEGRAGILYDENELAPRTFRSLAERIAVDNAQHLFAPVTATLTA